MHVSRTCSSQLSKTMKVVLLLSPAASHTIQNYEFDFHLVKYPEFVRRAMEVYVKV